MFGFPTRVRSLYSGRPNSASELDRMKVADRDLGMAVTAFAPGSLVVKDGSEHLSLGFAAYDLVGQRPIAKDPLGTPLPIRRCVDCGSLDTRPAEIWNNCEICASEMRTFMLYQPEGFRTNYSHPDFDDSSAAPMF